MNACKVMSFCLLLRFFLVNKDLCAFYTMKTCFYLKMHKNAFGGNWESMRSFRPPS